MKAAGAISVKSYNQPRREQRQQILAAAREIGIMVVPEGGSLFMHNMTMVVDGHTTVEHTIPVANIYKDVLALWPPTKVGYTPTLLVGYGGDWGENYWYQKTNVWENPRLSKFVPSFVLDPRSRRRMMVPEDEFNHFSIAKIAADLDKAGVLVNTGAHGQREGLGLHWEIWMMNQGGLSPLESLRCATMNGARTLGMDQSHRLARARQARRPDRRRGQPPPGHPPVGEGHLDDGERPPLRRRDDERDRVEGKETRQVLVGIARRAAVALFLDYRGRIRGNNETYKPHRVFPGDIRDTAALEKWIRESIP